MGRNNSKFEFGKEHALPLSAPLTVIAASEHIDRLRARLDASWIADAKTIPCDVDAPLPLAELGDEGLVVVQLDPAVPSSMDRVHQLRTARPGLRQIVAMETADIRTVRMLVREGVADVVALPFSPDEIFETVVAVLETSKSPDAKPARLAPLIAVTRAQGGTGATTVASHLAASLAESNQAKVCVLDLDIQFGRMAEVLGLSPRRNLKDLFEAGKRLDSTVLQSVVARHGSGVSVVAAPSEILPIESVEEGAIDRIIDLARREYDYVVLDLPVGLSNWTLAVLSRADSIVMVTQQSIPSLQQSRRALDLFAGLGLDQRLISIVVNRVERKFFGGISLSDVEQALGRDVTVGLGADAQNIPIAQDQGLLVGEFRSKSSFAADIDKLAELLAVKLSRRSGS